MQIFFLKPDFCEPPHRVTHEIKLEAIKKSLETIGWDGPPLIGYLESDRIVLLSGSHRWAAAKALGFSLPVEVFARSTVEAAWGHPDRWRKIMCPVVRVKRKIGSVTEPGIVPAR